MREEYNRGVILGEVWAEPMSKVAPRYGMSDVGLKKLCARLQIPTPGRGFWAKVKAGRGVPPIPTLKAFKGNPRHLVRTINPSPVGRQMLESEDARITALLSYDLDPANKITVSSKGTRWHPMVITTKDALDTPHNAGRGLPSPHGEGLDISVSSGLRTRALRLANALVKAIEKRGFKVIPGTRHLELNVFGEPFSLSIVEPNRRSDYAPTKQELAAKARGEWTYWPRYVFTPSGRLEVRCNGITVKDGTHQAVEDQLSKLIIAIAIAIAIARRSINMLRSRKESARDEEQRLLKRAEAAARKVAQEEEIRRLEELKQSALSWQQAQLIRTYVVALEATARSDAEKQYVEWAKAKADWLDPTLDAPDVMLDQKILIPY